MASKISSAQLHVTFDVGDKHWGIFTYAEIPRKVFDIFIISVDICMHYMFVQKGDYLFCPDMASISAPDSVRTAVIYGLHFTKYGRN